MQSPELPSTTRLVPGKVRGDGLVLITSALDSKWKSVGPVALAGDHRKVNSVLAVLAKVQVSAHPPLLGTDRVLTSLS